MIIVSIVNKIVVMNSCRCIVLKSYHLTIIYLFVIFVGFNEINPDDHKQSH